MPSFTTLQPSVLLVIYPYCLILFSQVCGYPKPEVFVSSPVILPTHTTSLSCKVNLSSVSQCFFYKEGKTGTVSPPAPYEPHTSSCQMPITWEQIKTRWGVQPPSELHVKCYYTVLTSTSVSRPSNHSSSVSLFFLGELQKPLLSISHHQNDMLFIIVCEIPTKSWYASYCQLYVHKMDLILTAKDIKKGSRHFFCEFFVKKKELFRHLQSVRSRVVSCDYTVATQPPSVSPHSDPYTIPGYPPLTTNIPVTSSGAERVSDTTSGQNSQNCQNRSTVTAIPTEVTAQQTKDATTGQNRQRRTTVTAKPTDVPAQQTKDATTGQNTQRRTTGTAHHSTSTDLSSAPLPKTSKPHTGLLVTVVTCIALCIVLTGLFALCLCRTCQKRKLQSSQGTQVRTTQDIGPAQSRSTTGAEQAGPYAMITSIPMTVASDVDKKDASVCQQDDENPYHIYNTIPDVLSVSSQRNETYSLVQDHRKPEKTQQDMTYSLLQMH